MDRGFSSAENRRYLQRGGGHYIMGEKLRGDSAEAAAALSRQGRYHSVAGNLRVKEVRVDDGAGRDRFVICLNPDAAARRGRQRFFAADEVIRGVWLRSLAQLAAGLDALAPEVRRSDLSARYLVGTPDAVSAVTSRSGLHRLLEEPGSHLVLDQLPERRSLLGPPNVPDGSHERSQAQRAV